jgi:membrane-associated phospholipid phosphatase
MKKWYIVFIVLIGLATLFDESIAMIVFNHDSLFANLFYTFGELPSLILGTFAWLWTSLYLKRHNKVLWKLTCVFYLAFMISIFIQPLRYSNRFEYWMLVIPVILSVIVFRLLDKVTDEQLNRYHLHFLVIGLTVLSSILVPQFFKMIWERPRPYLVFSGIDFQAWYIGLNLTFDNAYKSFPSGHSAVAASFISLTVFKSKMGESHFQALKWSIYFYVLLMMVSRMVRGDHFMSDVLFGVMITIFSFVLIKNTYVK